MMSRVWAFLIIFAIVVAFLSGRAELVSSAVSEGAGAAISLLLSICGTICLWTGLMQIMRESGLSEKISKALRPILHILFKNSVHDKDAAEHIAANMSANLLGISNAATPFGLKAAKRIHKLSGGGTTPSNDLIMLMVINSASLQLIPTTVAAVRASLGSVSPYDILPAVWLSSAISVSCGIFAARFLAKFSQTPGRALKKRRL